MHQKKTCTSHPFGYKNGHIHLKNSILFIFIALASVPVPGSSIYVFVWVMLDDFVLFVFIQRD